MKMFIALFTFVVLYLVSSPVSNAQGIGNPGQIISTSYANATFGKPIESFSFNRKALINILRKSKGYIMFGYKNKKFIIADDKRQPLYPENTTLQNDDILHTFGMDIMLEFLSNIESPKVNIEMRPGGILTLSEEILGEADGSTLEYSVPCPPYCPW